MRSDPKLVEEMAAALAGRGDIVRRAMFGGCSWMLNGNMLCGCEVGRFMFRVGKDQEGAALARPGAAPVVFDGRKMGGLVWVDAKAARQADLQSWIALAENFVGALPPK